MLKSLSKSENLVEVILNTYLMATRWDFKLCCVASRLLFDLICCLEMEQIYQETVSNILAQMSCENRCCLLFKVVQLSIFRRDCSYDFTTGLKMERNP